MANSLVLRRSEADERLDARLHTVKVKHSRHETHLVFAHPNEPLTPVFQRAFAQVTAPIQIALPGTISGSQQAVVIIAPAGETPIDRPESGTERVQSTMRLQTTGATIAIGEWMYPSHALRRW